MTVNRNNISTSANGADIFTIGSAATPFTNFGNLTTSGDLARPIVVTADGLRVNNYGSVTTNGDGSAGILVGEPFGTHVNNAVVVNYGTITTTGFTFDDGSTVIYASAIDMYGTGNKAINYGTIANLNGDDGGMGSIGSNCLIANYGSINSNALGMVLDQIDGTEVDSAAVNYGKIHTSADGSYGIWLLVNDSSAKNYGVIQVDGVHSFGMALEGDHNHGENYGTILATGDQGRGVLLNLDGNEFVNRGAIQTTGEGSVGFRWAVGEVDPDSDGGSFTNYGTVQSAAWAVRGNEQHNTVINHGLLSGAVDLDASDDTYVAGKGGSLNGALTLGDGNDLIIFEKGGGSLTVTDFVAGAGTDDVVDLSAFGFDTFANVMSHATQSGTDVVLKLGAKDQIVLQNVALGALAADDFALGGSLVHTQAGISHHDLLGVG